MWTWYRRPDGGWLNLAFVIQVFRQDSTIHFQMSLTGDEVFDTYGTQIAAEMAFELLEDIITSTRK